MLFRSIGTFAGLWMFGFSINTLTLFAMVLAIGIVVDDAIVVLENVERLMREQHMAPFDAAIEAMREVQGAVIGIVLVLCAVFIPVAFLGGIAGQLYRQFAVTVTIAVVLTKAALREARQRGVHPFCITIDREADGYVRRMYGDVQFAVIDHLEALPRRLPRIYQRLTT